MGGIAEFLFCFALGAAIVGLAIGVAVPDRLMLGWGAAWSVVALILGLGRAWWWSS